MADNSTQLTKQEAAKYLWEEAPDLPEGKTCDIEFCTSTRAGNKLTVGDAWRPISYHEALPRKYYADTACFRKAVDSDTLASTCAPVDLSRTTRNLSNLLSLDARNKRISKGGSVDSSTPLPPVYSAQSDPSNK